jgi:hypothetical protein
MLVSSLSSFPFGVDVDKCVQNFQSEEAIKSVGAPTNASALSPKSGEEVQRCTTVQQWDTWQDTRAWLLVVARKMTTETW